MSCVTFFIAVLVEWQLYELLPFYYSTDYHVPGIIGNTRYIQQHVPNRYAQQLT